MLPSVEKAVYVIAFFVAISYVSDCDVAIRAVFSAPIHNFLPYVLQKSSKLRHMYSIWNSISVAFFLSQKGLENWKAEFEKL